MFVSCDMARKDGAGREGPGRERKRNTHPPLYISRCTSEAAILYPEACSVSVVLSTIRVQQYLFVYSILRARPRAKVSK